MDGLDAAPAEEPGNVVLVRDVGFDLSLPVFKDKIRACYHVECEPLGSTTTREEELARRSAPDKSCRLVPGVRLELPHALSDVDSREIWNTRVRDRSLSELASEELSEKLDLITGGGAFHGTMVASLIAYDNPDTKFVVVDDPRIGATADGTSCPTPEAFDRELEFLRDVDVVEARRTEPRALLDEQLDGVFSAYGVAVVNRSAAPRAREELSERCPGLDWETFFALSADALTARQQFEQRTVNRNLLLVTAAGNAGVTLDSRADSSVCAPSPVPFGSYGEDSRDLVIGASRRNDDGETIAEFSNRGACVSAFAPGNLIITSAPNGWLAVLSGTSVATPLATRYVMTNHADPFRALDVYQDFTQLDGRFLPSNAAPEGPIYEIASGAPLLF